MIRIRREVVVSAVMALAIGCGGDGEETTVDSADGGLEEPRRKGPPYEVVEVTATGVITGSVTFAPATAPTGASTPDASGAATAPAAVPAPATTACPAAPSSSDVVVYIEDIARGRALPDSMARRYDLAVSRCDIQPRVLLAAPGGTLNFSNAHNAVHWVTFTFEGMKNPMLRIPFSDAGQIVPTEKVLAVPGHVTVASDQGPGVIAHVVVLEHPYAATARNGSFTLDSVPPGTYTLVAVGAAGRATSAVRVEAGRTTNVELRPQP